MIVNEALKIKNRMELDDDVEKCPYITLDISKKRSLTQRPVSFTDSEAVVMAEVAPDRNLEADYVTRVRMSRETQAGPDIGAAIVNTRRQELVGRGMSHTEGGWPRDVNQADAEQKSRFRKKIEKDDDFIYKTRLLVRETEKYVQQNNSINIFEDYFEEVDHATEVKPASVGSMAVFKDPLSRDSNGWARPINCVSWSPGGDTVAMAVCDTEFLAYYERNIDLRSLVYDVTNPLVPVLEITPASALVTLQHGKREPGLLVCGTLDGHLVLVDTRAGGCPVLTAEVPDSLGDPVTGLAWLASKSGSEVVASVGDGRVVRWDTRVTRTVVSLDINSSREAQEARHGATGVCFDQNAPNRYLVSSDLGSVMSCSLKNDKIISEYNGGHFGSVLSVQRCSANSQTNFSICSFLEIQCSPKFSPPQETGA